MPAVPNITGDDLAVYDGSTEHQYKYNPDAEEGTVLLARRSAHCAL